MNVALIFKVAEPETRYDPIRLEEQLFKQPVRWLVRNVQLFVPLGTFVATVLLDIQVGDSLCHSSFLHSVVPVPAHPLLWLVF